MKSPHITAAALLLLPGTAFGAFSVGGIAYTKRLETRLLATPSATAATVATVGYGKKMQVQEVKGLWLRVKETKTEGWVFNGNVSDTELKESAGIDIPVAASATSTTAAARPLAPAASDYADRQGKGAARGDVVWLEAEATKTGPAEVLAYLQQEGKGEFAK